VKDDVFGPDEALLVYLGAIERRPRAPVTATDHGPGSTF
jgi:hypothetical protein